MMKKIINKILSRPNAKMVNSNKVADSLKNTTSKTWLQESSIHIKLLEDRYTDFALTEYGEQYLVTFMQCKFIVSNKSEFLILREVFVDGVYNFNLDKNVIVFDIGMNVGISSIFFAQKDNVKAVYSYEPVDDTYDSAITNINLNPTIKEKIKTFNFGLSSVTEKQKFTYNPNNKGSFGHVGNKKFDQTQFEEKEVQLVSIKDELNKVLNIHDLPYILKVDCEGAEYDIIPELKHLNKLPILIMMEWHLSNGQILVNALKELGFAVMFITTEKTAGMIYAFRHND